MPIDPNIALGYRGIEVPNPLAGMAQVAQIQNALQQQQIGQMQLKQLQEDRQEMQALQAKLAQMGKNPDMSVLAETLMRSPKTLEKGIELRRKLDQQAGFERFLAGQNPASATAAAPATAGIAAQPSPNVAAAIPVPMTRTTNAPPIEVKPDEAYPATMPPRAAENALAPQPTGVNAMRQLRTPEAIRAEMMQLAQFSDVPQAKAYMKALETELAEAMKPQVVSPGQAVYQGGRLVVSRPETPTTLTRLTQERDALPKDSPLRPTYDAAIKRASEGNPPQIQVTIPPGEQAEQKGRGEALVSHEKDVRAAADAARRSSVNLESAQAALDKGFRTGFGTDAKVAAANVLSSVFGMKDASKYATTGQLFNQTIMEQVLARQLQQKGVQTNQDAERIKAAGIQLGNTVEANQFMLDVARAQNERAIAQDKFYRDWLKDPANKGSLRGAEDAWLEAEGNSSIFDTPRLQKYKSVGRAEPASVPAAGVIDFGSLK